MAMIPMILRLKKRQGYVALISVTLLSALMLAVSISLVSAAINDSQSTLDWEQAAAARLSAESCTEIAMDKLSADLNYWGDETIMIGSQSCNIPLLGGFGNGVRLISASSTVAQSYVKRYQMELDRLVPSIWVNLSREVANY